MGMNKIKTKHQIRQELEEEVNAFLSRGGAIQEVERGESGKTLGENLQDKLPLNPEKNTRTLLVDEVKALDERKQAKTSKPTPHTHTPKKKIIYDDFGEPLREVWE